MSHEEILSRILLVKETLYPKSDTETAVRHREKRKKAGHVERIVLSKYNLKDYISLAFLYGMKEPDIIREVTENSGIHPEQVKTYIRICRREMTE